MDAPADGRRCYNSYGGHDSKSSVVSGATVTEVEATGDMARQSSLLLFYEKMKPLVAEGSRSGEEPM